MNNIGDYSGESCLYANERATFPNFRLRDGTFSVWQLSHEFLSKAAEMRPER